MTYVDDDDFDDFDSDSDTDDIKKGEAGRCDECGLKVKREDAIVCHMCSAVYHRWCAGAECNVCKTPLEVKAEVKNAKPKKRSKK